MHTENFQATIDAIADRLANSSIAYAADRRFASELEHGKQHGRFSIDFCTQTGTYNDGTVRFSSVTLYVRCDSFQRSYTEVKEEDGSRWARRDVYCEVNWSALGSHPAWAAKNYAALIDAVAELAESIESEWRNAEVWQCVWTAEEERTAVAERAAKALQQAVDEMEIRPRMHVGDIMPHARPTGLTQSGEWLATRKGGKQFLVTCYNGTAEMVQVKRTA